MLGRHISLAASALLLVLAMGCKTKYVCPAYTSAFLLDMPAYKVSKAADSMAIAADTSLDIDVIAVLAERIWPVQEARTNDPDSLEFPSDRVVKTQYLLIRKVAKKKKNKLLATVPMVTVFPASTDSTEGGEGAEAIPADERPRDMSEEQAPAGEESAPAQPTESAPAEEKPATVPEKKEEDTQPF